MDTTPEEERTGREMPEDEGIPDLDPALPQKEITGDPLGDPNRHTRIQVLGWNADGTPDFGIPVADGGRQ
jgi:hypothetical protein